MSGWKDLLNCDATDWLLEESNPSVRYLTLRWLLDHPERSRDVVQVKQAIARSAPVRKIIERQRPEGYWGPDARPHHGTEGPLMLLLWLGAPKNPAIVQAMNYRLAGCLLENGAYGMKLQGRTLLLPCHGAEVLRLMRHYGYADDARSRRLLNWLVSTQQPDGVWCCLSKVKRLPCMWATADVLRALNDLPPKWATGPIKTARDRAVELFLNSGLCQYGKKKPSPDWFQFGYPLRWTSDILDVLESIAPFVRPDDPRIQAGLELVLAKQDRQGRWACEKKPRGGMWMERYVEMDRIGEPSKWVTLHVYRMLKTLHAG